MNLLKTLQEEARRAETAQPSFAYAVWARLRSLFTEDEVLSWMGTRPQYKERSKDNGAL
jgi:hypothetical protein